ncbi:MAG: hypothetical protein O3A46_05255 [Candidatus Poribacteria bacterium]|nr:hypothetical protein [Candidatus Poribacteria bacterium]
MATTKVQAILKQVEELSPEEQKELGEQIDRLLSGEPPVTALERRLIETGDVERPGNPKARAEWHRANPPLKWEDKPVSETIIEERR